MKPMPSALLFAGILALSSIHAKEAVKETAPQVLTLDIAAQPIGDALNEFARQSGLQVVIDPAEGRGVVAARVVGKFTATEALAQLLSNTGLRYEYLDARTVAIRSQKSRNAERRSATEAELAEPGSLRLAEQQKSQSNDGVEEMLVEGERDKPAPFSTANLDLTRTEDDVLPFLTFNARDIELSGATSLNEFFRKRLPQNFSNSIPEEIDGDTPDSDLMSIVTRRGVSIKMRDWDASETVYLLNGRRMPAQYRGTDAENSDATPNLAMIPLASIERIEILPSAAGAIYGESATAGIINIITRQDFKGGEAAVGYRTPADVHRPQRSVDLSFGQPLPWGFGLRFSGGYADSDPLRAGDRADVTIERWRRIALERNPNRVISRLETLNPINSNGLPYGATPNISTVEMPRSGSPSQFRARYTVANLFGAGTPNFTTVPDGQTAGGVLGDFEPGAFNLNQAPGALSYGTRTNNTTVNRGLDRNFSDLWRWSMDFAHARSERNGRSNGSYLSFTNVDPLSRNARVPATASTNPFGQDVSVRLIDGRMVLPDLNNTQRGVSRNISTTLRGGIGEWRGFFDASFSENEDQTNRDTFWEPTGGWYNALATGAYNPFVDVRTVAPASADFYRNYVARREVVFSASRGYQSALKISGPAFKLPAGPLQFTGGVNWGRADRNKSYIYAEYRDAVTGELTTPVSDLSPEAFPINNAPERRFVLDSYGGYAELNVPVVAAGWNVPLVRDLHLFVSRSLAYADREGFTPAAERIKYTDSGQMQSTGFGYQPLQGVTLRFSQSGGMRPPNFSSVTPTPLSAYEAVWGYPADYLYKFLDPVRQENTELGMGEFVRGGNPNLKPESTQSRNLGLILSPAWSPGLRVSIDYLENVRNDAITELVLEDFIAYESDISGRVVRGPADGHPSGAGPIVFVDFRYVNFHKTESKSMDLSVDADLGSVFGGRLSLAARATRNLSFKIQFVGTEPPQEQLRRTTGAFSSFGKQIEWNANGQVSWQRQRWSFGWSTRYMDYILVDPITDPGFVIQGSDRAPWALEHDMSINYRAAPTHAGTGGMQWLLDNSSISCGVNNVFDRKPRFWSAFPDFGVAPGDSVAGRSFWLSVRRGF